jgi:Domain of unknown function (DUF4815)
MAINFKTEPYHDDYDVGDKYYRILFKPGYAVQARELTQLQTILQNQIAVNGRHLYKQGAMVIPGNASIDTAANYVIMSGTFTDAGIAGIIGQTLIGVTSGVTALVVHAVNVEGSDAPTLFVKYTNSGTSSTTKTFTASETLNIYGSIQVAFGTVANSNATGIGSIATIKSGFFFIKDAFVYTTDQTIVLDKYSSTPSYKIGLDAIEYAITSDDDSALLDNAQGFSNFNAPGADRWKIDLVFNKYALSSNLNQDNFIQLITVEAGSVIQKIDNTEYNVLEKNIARRTYDESGDYTVKNFKIDVREYRNNYRGQWLSYTNYLAGDIVINGGNYYRARNDGTTVNTAPTQIVGSSGTASDVIFTYESNPYFNRGINTPVVSESLPTQRANKAQLAIGMEPGKAYVRGYEIEKVGKEFLTVQKSRSTIQETNITVPATVGNYILVTNMYGLPNILEFPLVNLYSNYTTTGGIANPGTNGVIGTARVRYLEFANDTVQGLNTTHYKLSLFDIKMTGSFNFNRDVKQLYLASASAGSAWTADIYPDQYQLSGSVTSSGTTVTGFRTLFLTELKVGDYILTTNTSGVTQRRQVQTIPSNTSLTVDSAYGIALTGELPYRSQTSLKDTDNTLLMFPAPYQYVANARNATGGCDTSYTAAVRFPTSSTGNVVADAAALITINATGADIFASPDDPDNYLVLLDSTGVTGPQGNSGQCIAPVSVTYGTTTSQIKIQLPYTAVTNTVYAGKNYVVIAAVKRSGTATEKTKTLSTSTETYTDANITTANNILLTKADGLRLLKVLMDNGTFATPINTTTTAWTTNYTDITSRYSFNNGQQPTHYGLSSLVLNSGEAAPTSRIQVVYEYFSHIQGTGADHFSINSYSGVVSFDEIPSFNGVSLGDVFDFRPRISDSNASGFAGGTLSCLPKRGVDITTSFTHYTGRKDKILMGQDGKFFTVSGIPALSPAEPVDNSSGMVLYKLELYPYTKTTDSIDVTTVDNKRYTMRDIGKLEKRIDNIEYYTSLSMLEQDTQSLEIQDQDGFNRFKNGFIVDNFTGINIGDAGSIDYRCSLDMENGLLRPSYTLDNVNIIEESNSTAARTTKGYQVTGDLVTLPYTETAMVSQLNSSRVENINPFAIFTFIGNIDLNPPSDEWFETKRLPDIVTNVEGNFNLVKLATERLGILGTVWNAWQTQWTGVPVDKTVTSTVGTGRFSRTTTSKVTQTFNQNNASRDFLNAIGGNWHSSGNWSLRSIVAQVIATPSIISRTGIQTSLMTKIDRTVTDDRVLSTAIIPYIRARALLFIVRGLKPNTTFTPFFDSVNVGTFTTPASTLKLNALNSVFSYTVPAGGSSAEVARRVNGSAQSGLDRGDVVYVTKRTTGGVTSTYTYANTPTTAVLAFSSSPLNAITGVVASNTTLHVVNINGTFLPGDEITGSITGGVGIIDASGVTVKTVGNALVSNSAGDVVGIFNIPNTSSNRFRTGEREFKLSDDPLDSAATRTSTASKKYHASGVLQTKQASVTATRNAEIVTQQVSQTQSIVQESYRVVSDTGWYDPLAQTFLVDSKGGAFVTSVDIFFATKDNTIPVRMQIREVVNGYPGKTILPFSEVILSPENVNISATKVNTSDGQSLPAPIATNFKFPSPVYLNDKTEYCIVLLSDSNNYKAWISQMGDTSVVTGNVITSQPYNGVLFKSQNASTWTANQDQDLMFKINQAQFSTSVQGQPTFINAELPLRLLGSNPFYAVTGTNYIRVTQENHGMWLGSNVTISGVVNAVGGIPAAQINGTHPIVWADFDSYIIQSLTGGVAGSNATATGNFGSPDIIFATQNILYSTIQPIIAQQIFSDTNLTHSITTVSGKSTISSPSSSNGGSEAAYQTTIGTPITPNENNILQALQMIGPSATETLYVGNGTATKISLRITSTMSTNNTNVSPVIDIGRLSAALIQDRINYPSDLNTNFTTGSLVYPLDSRNIVAGVLTVGVSGNNTFITSDTTTKLAFLTAGIGKYIVTSGFATAANNGKFMITNIAADGSSITVASTALIAVAAGATVTIKSIDRFVDEIAPVGGSAIAKYVTSKINFQNPTTYLKVKFAADIEQTATVSLYYKTQSAGSIVDFTTIPYVKATPIKSAVSSNDGMFTDVEYEMIDLPAFDAIQVKLVMNSTFGADIAQIADLQVIGCA